MDRCLPRSGSTSSKRGRQRLDSARVTRNSGSTLRAGLAPLPSESGAHVCFRARSTELVDAFHAAALGAGGSSDGAPGLRPAHGEGYYAAFIRDPDGNRIEAVTFVEAK